MKREEDDSGDTSSSDASSPTAAATTSGSAAAGTSTAAAAGSGAAAASSSSALASISASQIATTFVTLVAVTAVVIPLVENADLEVNLEADFNGGILYYMIELTNTSDESEYYAVVMEDQAVISESRITGGYQSDTISGLNGSKEHRVEVRTGTPPLLVVGSAVIPGEPVWVEWNGCTADYHSISYSLTLHGYAEVTTLNVNDTETGSTVYTADIREGETSDTVSGLKDGHAYDFTVSTASETYMSITVETQPPSVSLDHLSAKENTVDYGVTVYGDASLTFTLFDSETMSAVYSASLSEGTNSGTVPDLEFDREYIAKVSSRDTTYLTASVTTEPSVIEVEVVSFTAVQNTIEFEITVKGSGRTAIMDISSAEGGSVYSRDLVEGSNTGRLGELDYNTEYTLTVYSGGVIYATQSVTTEKAVQKPTANPISFTYGETKAVQVTGLEEEPVITYTVQSGTAVTVDPATGVLTWIGAGVSTVTASFAETQHYAAGSIDVSVTTYKATQPVTGHPFTFTYGGPNQLSVSGVQDGADVTYSVGTGTVVTVTAGGKLTWVSAGEVGVTATIGETQHYSSKSITIAVTAVKATQSPSADAIEFHYGQTASVEVSGLEDSPEMSYAVQSGTAVTVDEDGALQWVEFGESTVRASFAETEHYLEGYIDVSVTTTKGVQPATDFDFTFTYGGEDQLEVEVIDGAAVSYVLASGSSVTVSTDGKLTWAGAGVSTVTASIAETDHYDAKDVTITVTAEKAVQPATDFDFTFTYGGANQLSVSDVLEDADITYSVGTETVVTVTSAGVLTWVSAGEAGVIAIMGETDHYAEKDITITVTTVKATQPATDFDFTFTYGGEDQLEVEVIDGAAVSYVVASGTSITVTSSGALTWVSAGDTTVTASIAETDHYDAKDITITVTAEKATQTATDFDFTFTYGGEDQLEVETLDSAAVSYTIASGTSVTVTVGGKLTWVSAGDTTVTASIAETDHYASKDITITVTAEKAVQSPSAEAIEFQYGQTKSVVVSGLEDSPQMSYAVQSGTSVTVDGSTGALTWVASGETTVRASFAETDHYVAGYIDVSVTTAKATQSPTADPISFTYGQTASVVVSGLEDSPQMSYAVQSGSSITVDESTGVLTWVASGETTVRASFAETTYYEAGYIDVTVTTAKATQNPTADAIEFQYGQTASVEVSGLEDLPQMSYAVQSGTSVTIDGSTGALTWVAAGVTTVRATFAETTYYEAGYIDVSVTATKAEQTATDFDFTFIYGGEDQLEVETLDSAAVSYAIASGSSVTVTAGGKLTWVSAGDTTVTASIAETDHYDAKDIAITVTAEKAVQNPSAEAIEFQYGQTKSVVVSGLEDTPVMSYAVQSGTSVTVDGSTGALTWNEVGTATVRASFAETDHYLEGYIDVSVTTSKATQSPTADPISFTYGETESVAVSGLEDSPQMSYAVQSGTSVTVDGSTGALTWVAAGTATVRASFAETTHYEAGYIDVSVTTVKGEQPATDFDFTFTYGGADQLSVSDVMEDADVTYSVGTSTVVTVTTSGKLTWISAGEVGVTATIAETDHYDAKDITITVTAEKATQNPTADPIEFQYGQTVSVSISGLEDTPQTSYAVEEGSSITVDGSTGALTWVTAGETTVRASFTETTHYEAGYIDVTVTTTKAVQPATDFDFTFTYGGTDQLEVETLDSATVSYTIASGSSVTVTTGGKLTWVSAGESAITATIAETDHYDSKDITITVSAEKSIQSPTADPVSFTYGQTKSVLVSGLEDTPQMSYAVQEGTSVTVDGSTGALTWVTAGETTVRDRKSVV